MKATLINVVLPIINNIAYSFLSHSELNTVVISHFAARAERSLCCDVLHLSSCAPKPPPILALLYCITKPKIHESCCLSIAPFCNTATYIKLKLIIHTKKDKNYRVTVFLPDSIVTFLNPKSNILSSTLCEAELRLCVAQSGALGSSFTSAIDPRRA